MAKRMRLPNGFGQISELKGRKLRNKWRAMVTTGWTDTGKPLRKIVGFYHTYNEAYTALVKYHESPNGVDTDITLEELYDRWSEEHYKRIVHSTIKSHKMAWKRCESIYHMKVRDIRVSHVKAVIEADMPPTIQRLVRNLLSMLMDYAVEYELAEKNYVKLATIHLDPHEHKHHESFSPAELDVLWRNSHDETVRMILIQCYTGFRPSEMLSLKQKNISVAEWTILGGMKTKAGKNRIVPVHTRIKPFIEMLYDEKKENLFEISYKVYDKRFTKICEQLGLTHHTPHDARSTFVTNLKRAGADEYAIKRLVGHAIKDLTESVYTSRDIRWLRSELERMS